MLHRFILEVSDRKIEVDHRDGDGRNNCRSNLRAGTHTQNQRNMKKHFDGSSAFKGVYWVERAKKWQVQIWVNGASLYLGLFVSAEEAAHVYDNAAIKYYKEFACLNFPREG